MRKSLGRRTGAQLSRKGLIAVLLLVSSPSAAKAQATHLMVPARNTLLRFTQGWGRESALGDLTMVPMAATDLEVRFWGGYGLVGTSAVVLRRTGGVWQAWRAEVQPCPVRLPISIGDTITAPALAPYREQARATCGDRSRDTLSAAAVFMADTVGLYPLDEGDYEAFWQELKSEGILELPPKVRRSWMMLDGHTYVVEVRRGNDYRASVIEHTTPETRADTVMQRLAALIQRGPLAALPAR
jgi:hypothetical protein